MADYDAIVVGSGAGGLSAALRLAQSDLSVLLLEAMPSLGGYLNPFRRKGYTFGTGLHFMGELGEQDAFRGLLDELGIGNDLVFVELNPDGYVRCCFPDFELQICKGQERFADRLVTQFPQEEPGIRKFFEIFEKIIRAMGAAQSMKRGALGTIRFLLQNPIMLKYARVPFQKLLDDVTSNRQLQAVLAAPWFFYGSPPAKASIMIAIQVWSHILKGVYYPHGGSGAFRDAFVNKLKSLGAVIKKNMPVVSIDKQGHELIVETQSGEQFSGRAVISNADPAVTLGKLVNKNLLSSRLQNKILRLQPSSGAFYAFVGTDLDLSSLGISDTSLIHYVDYDINKIYDMLHAPNPPEVFPTFFLSSPTLKDSEGRHAPEARHSIEIFTGSSYATFKKWAKLPSMKRGQEYDALKEKIGQRLIKAVEHYIPNLSQHLDLVEYATPLSNEFWVGAVRGANYGLEQTPAQSGPGRFTDFTTGIDGLFLAGSGTLAGGIMACVASGFLSANKAIEYL